MDAVDRHADHGEWSYAGLMSGCDYCNAAHLAYVRAKGLVNVTRAGSATDDYGQVVSWINGDWVDPVLLERAAN